MIGVLHLSHYGNTTTKKKKKTKEKPMCPGWESHQNTSDYYQWQKLLPVSPPLPMAVPTATLSLHRPACNSCFWKQNTSNIFFTFPRECPKQHQNKGTRCWCLYNTHSSEMFYQDQNICRWVRDSTMVCIKGRPENYISGYRICDGERRYHPETTDSSVPHCSCSGGPGAAQRLFSLSAARLRSARDGQTG